MSAEREIKIQCVMNYARADVNPNFTHYQLKLAELGCTPDDYAALRYIMEDKLRLRNMDKRLDEECMERLKFQAQN